MNTQDIQDVAEHLPQQVQAGIAQARVEIDQLDERARAFVRERPVMALLGAIGIGYFVARIFSRF
jgi:hypothetical protein